MTLGTVSRKYLITLIVILSCASVMWAGQWMALGPDGGDVRSLTYDPRNPDHIFLGTSTGTLFASQDGGHSWARFAHLGSGDDYVLDHITINPQLPDQMFVAAWSVENQQAGDLFRSNDGGKTWDTLRAMHGKSIRAMAISASDPKTIAVGALDGVYRSQDSGNTWQQISKSNLAEIKNVESIAIDHKNPDVIYAGTWHLAWKTDDGGANWHHINKGMIDDSDVFSVIVDSTNSANVYASACSGIYKSENGGDLFKKLQGIPFSARRTRVLKQDPANPNTVYAGTTEGLWKTTDGGKGWQRVSNPEVVVNDVMIDPRDSNRVLLATDRSGVLASNDGSKTWEASNKGYAHRYVTSIIADKTDPNAMIVGVVNDREFGGVFFTRDGGQHWLQKSIGLEGRDVFSVQQTNTGALVAGTNRGMFMLDHNASAWRPINTIVSETVSTKTVKKGTKKTQVATKKVSRSVLTARVSDVELGSKRWLAATSAGLFSSTDEGKTWTGGAVLGKTDFVSVQSQDDLMIALTRTSVLVSTDAGISWKQGSIPTYVTSLHDAAITPDGQIMVASREGAFRSSDSGSTWEKAVNGLPDKHISSVSYDRANKALFATSNATGVIFQSRDGGRSWQRGPDSGYPLRRISIVRGHFVGATPFDGIVIQPENESANASAEPATN